MAPEAVDVLVRAGQRKPRGGVVELPGEPVIGRVALLAFCLRPLGELAGMGIAVTGFAAGVSQLVDGICPRPAAGGRVAPPAGDRPVASLQRESRELMVYGRPSPGFLHVAAFAPLPTDSLGKLPAVRALVAGRAVEGLRLPMEPDTGFRPGVAQHARHRLVGVFQREPRGGVLELAERGRGETGGCVTALAGPAVGPVVELTGVRVGVAGPAGVERRQPPGCF